MAKGRGNQNPVKGDVLNFPAGGAEREDVAYPGFVDHLLIEFADAATALVRLAGGTSSGRTCRGPGVPGAHDEHTKEPPVRDGPA